MASSSHRLPNNQETVEAAAAVAYALENTSYAVVGGAACAVLGSTRETSDVDFVVPKGKTKAARDLLRQNDDYFEVEKRTQYTFYKSSPKIEIEILTPPTLFKQEFNDLTPVLTVDDIKVLHPALLLNAKCGSMLGRSSSEKKVTDAADIAFLLRWCAEHDFYPSSSEVPNATKDFVEYFISVHGRREDWTNARYDLENAAIDAEWTGCLTYHLSPLSNKLEHLQNLGLRQDAPGHPTAKDGAFGHDRRRSPMDEAVIALLPSGTEVLSAESYGTSAWTQTGRVTIQLPDGTVKRCFLKLALGDHGRQLLLGEFTAITTLNELIPGLVPIPLGWGRYTFEPPETHFFIEEFRDMDMRLPKPTKLAQRVLQLHSLTSPNGMFGFPVTTFDGISPNITEWEPNWTTFFVRLLRKSVELNMEKNGELPELSLAAERLLTVVVPRLLDPLQSGNQPIIPRLIHADLWSGNIGMDEKTGEFIFFDAGCFYAHNELELGMWRRYGVQNLGQAYLDEYKRLFPPSEPQNEFDDRNRLYCLKYDLNHSSGIPGDKARDVALNNMIYLCQKYASAEGLPEYDPKKDPSAGDGYLYAR